jgi:23S rRNA pseudouridine1911/1915/1917 synthase
MSGKDTSNGAFVVPAELAGKTLAAAIRVFCRVSWAQAKQSIITRHIRVNETLCVDETRRLRGGERIDVSDRPSPAVPRERDVRILHADQDLVVVDKPAGLLSLRRGEERDWSETKKDRQPTLDELLAKMLPGKRVRPVHRLDRDTSGLMLYALSTRCETELIRLLARHQVQRTYLAIVLGRMDARTVDTRLVRDRGDGLRGTGQKPATQPPDAHCVIAANLQGNIRADTAQRAVTHCRPIQHIADKYTLVECRLETGRTHQIRIHLSEIGHMLCGEKLYIRPTPTSDRVVDNSDARRQCLHSTELRFVHPFTRQTMIFESPLPGDLMQLWRRLVVGLARFE